MNRKEIICYQRLPEDFYKIMKRRNLKADEAFFAIYLRGKYCRFGNPFKCYDDYITQETGMSYKVISRIRKKLQLKGVINFDTFYGRGRATIYTMLDTYMIPPKKIKGARMGEKTFPNGHLLFSPICAKKGARMGRLIIKNIDKKENHIISSLKTNNIQLERWEHPKNWLKETLDTIK